LNQIELFFTESEWGRSLSVRIISVHGFSVQSTSVH